MNMTERAGFLCFQRKGMDSVLKNHHKIPCLKKESFRINVHGALARINQVNFNRFVDVFCKYIRIFPFLPCRADDRLRAKKDVSASKRKPLVWFVFFCHKKSPMLSSELYKKQDKVDGIKQEKSLTK